MPRKDVELCDNILLTVPARLPTKYGAFRIYAFQCPFTGEDHVALVKGRIAGRENVLVRLHSECITGDAFGVLGFPADLRTYKCAACVLRVLGVRSVRLMTNNPRKIEELESYGVRIVERLPLQVAATPTSVRYLRTKKDRLRHLLDPPEVTPRRQRRRPGPR